MTKWDELSGLGIIGGSSSWIILENESGTKGREELDIVAFIVPCMCFK